MKVLCFAGSLRKDSLNKLYVRCAAKLPREQSELDVEVVDLWEYSLPVYNQDLEPNQFPAAAVALDEKVKAAQALVISSPENNGAIAAVSKNTFGAVRGLWHTRVHFEALGCHVYPEMSGLARAHEAMDASAVQPKDTAAMERLKAQLNKVIQLAGGKR